ncbi:MAG TPA: hypothetical protein VF183_10155 [Acidimicrobiales bacterium]
MSERYFLEHWSHLFPRWNLLVSAPDGLLVTWSLVRPNTLAPDVIIVMVSEIDLCEVRCMTLRAPKSWQMTNKGRAVAPYRFAASDHEVFGGPAFEEGVHTTAPSVQHLKPDFVSRVDELMRRVRAEVDAEDGR